MTSFTESIIEQAALDWLKELGYAYAFGPDLAFDGPVYPLASLRDALFLRLMRGEVKVKGTNQEVQSI